MKNYVKFGGLVALALMTAACSKVEAGNVGVKTNLYGSDKGVQAEVVGPGRYWLSWNEELHVFPTFVQTVNWTNTDEGDYRIVFQDIDGAKIKAGIAISYAINKHRAADLFQSYRKGIDEITNTVLRTAIQDAFNAESSKLRVDVIYGPQKELLIKRVRDRVDAQFRPQGILVDRILWSGDMELPETVQASLNAKIKANQMAMQRENELRQTEAEAKKRVAEAEGIAASTLKRAEAEAKANEILARSVTPALTDYMKAKKWDGRLPQVSGGATPIIDMRN